jgi:ribokinase
MKFDVITFGSATIDIFADTYDRKKLSKRDKRYHHLISYPTGSKILIKELNSSIGGGGTNTAVTFSRFGLSTAFCGCIGRDTNGSAILDYLQKEKIAFIGHSCSDETATSIVLDSIEHDRTILTYKGASNHLSASQIKKEHLNCDVAYFSSLMEDSFTTQKKILSKMNPRLIAFNPSCYQSELGVEKLSWMLKKTDIIILNKQEAQALICSTSPHEIDLLKNILPHIKKNGKVIITDGPKGAYFYDGVQVLHAIPEKTKVVETTGAGDAFASAFVAAIARQNDVITALKMALANSKSVVLNRGAKNIILTYDQAKKWIKKHKSKIVVL